MDRVRHELELTMNEKSQLGVSGLHEKKEGNRSQGPYNNTITGRV